MSYDIALIDPKTKQIIEFDKSHNFRGGIYSLREDYKGAWLNITYNYANHFQKVFGKKGIRTIFGMNGYESAPLLVKAIQQLKNNVDTDYWKPTEGNAKAALIGLLHFALLRPDGIWEGD
jgi:hypothetical protein